ncbi:hypothetical protein ABZZ01_13815 [Streptomyces virginiae]|uniref:hypothetical protein n=1 Tax=Streptomyces virginiae TaxID=1961 RepID=UPI0033AB1B46
MSGTSPATGTETGSGTGTETGSGTGTGTAVTVEQTASEQVPERREFGTGLLHTVVTGDPDRGYTWVRRPGPLSPAPFAAPGLDLAGPHGPAAPIAPDAPDAQAPAGAVRWAPGTETAEPGGRRYRVRGPESVARRLLHHGPDEDLVAVLEGVGRLLRTLHETPVPQDLAGDPQTRPRGLVRFTDWLAGRAASPRAAYAESRLRPRLGETRMAALHALCARIADEPDPVLCHGAPALGSLVPAVPSGGADLLIGEDLCLAPWYFDLGWILGELVELKWYRGDGHPAWPRLLDALFQGYGRDLGDEWGRLAALRVLLHLHDYTAYVGWDEKTFEKYTGFAMFLLDL